MSFLLCPSRPARTLHELKRWLFSALVTALVVVGAVFPRTITAQHVAQAPAPDSAAAAALRAANVAIAVGDRVRVKVWREPAFSDSLTVDERGVIVLPRLGPLLVAGRTIGSLQDTLRTRFEVYLRDPALTVTVYRRVGLQGEVRVPNLYYVDATMSLREVLAMAGGITEAGNPDDVAIVRDGRARRLGRWRDGGPLSAELRSGDQILVGRRSWLSRNALAAVSTLGLVVSVGLQAFRR